MSKELEDEQECCAGLVLPIAASWHTGTRSLEEVGLLQCRFRFSFLLCLEGADKHRVNLELLLFQVLTISAFRHKEGLLFLKSLLYKTST